MQTNEWHHTRIHPSLYTIYGCDWSSHFKIQGSHYQLYSISCVDFILHIYKTIYQLQWGMQILNAGKAKHWYWTERTTNSRMNFYSIATIYQNLIENRASIPFCPVWIVDFTYTVCNHMQERYLTEVSPQSSFTVLKEICWLCGCLCKFTKVTKSVQTSSSGQSLH